MKPITHEELLKLHKEKFGVEPVITGYYAQSDTTLTERIAEAYIEGIPYVEPEVPDGADV